MKKTLLLAGCAFMMAASALASSPLLPLRGQATGKYVTSSVTAEYAPAAKAQVSRAVTEFDYTLAGEPYTCLGFKEAKRGDVVAQAFEIPAEIASTMAGNTIDKVYFYTGLNNTTRRNRIKEATIFLTHDLEAEPFYTQDVSGIGETPWAKVEVPLTTPQSIDGTQPVYVGVKCAITNSVDYAIVVDNLYHGQDYNGGWVAYTKDGGLVWDNISEYYGFVCVGAIISGDNFPVDGVAPVSVDVIPILEVDTPFSLNMVINNQGVNDITSLEVVTKVGNEAERTSTVTLNAPLPFYNQQYVEVPGLTYSTPGSDLVPIEVKITKVNGNDNTSAVNSTTASATFIPKGSSFERRVVIEEFTGTWCQFCPVGIYTMEKIREEFPNGEFIPVAVHTGDEMDSGAFSELLGAFAGAGVPSSVLNRMNVQYPFPYEDVYDAYEQIHEIPALVDLSFDARYTNDAHNELSLTTRTKYLFANDKASETYGITFVVTEDNVGPYTQINGYAGRQQDCGGWENQPSRVSVVYNDVARLTTGISTGISGAVPASVEPDHTYEFNYILPIGEPVTDPTKINVVAYVINLKSGIVENASIVRLGNLSGVENMTVGVDADANAPVEYFNLQGMRVDEPSAGIYIRRQGSTITKVVVR